MDKETLSNYGWIVIAVLVLVVMIALATPFGTFVSEAVQSTTKGLFDVNKSALDSTGLINIDNQEFDVPDMNHGAENGGNTGETPVVPETPVELYDMTFCNGTTQEKTTEQYVIGMTWGEWIDSKYNTIGAHLNSDGYVCVDNAPIDYMMDFTTADVKIGIHSYNWTLYYYPKN